MADNNAMIRIGGSQLCSQLFNMAVSLAFSIFYTYAYSELKGDVLNDPLSKCFLATIIIGWIYKIIGYINIRHINRYYGQTMSKELFEYLNPINKFPLNILKLLYPANFGLSIYFMILFTPIQNDNCNIYKDYHNACVSMQISTVFTLLTLAFTGLYLAIMLLSSCLMCCMGELSIADFCNLCCYICCCECFKRQNNIAPATPEMQNRSRRNNTFTTLQSYMMSYLPITLAPPADGICAICTQDAQANDQWRELTCGHKFHPTCIDPWIQQHHSCPLCRAHVAGVAGVAGVADVPV